MARLTDEEIARGLIETPWTGDGDAIAREGGITQADLDMARRIDALADG